MKALAIIAIAVVLLMNLVPTASAQAQNGVVVHCPTMEEASYFFYSNSLSEIIANWNWSAECLLRPGQGIDWYTGAVVAGGYDPNVIYEQEIGHVFRSEMKLWINQDPYYSDYYRCPEEAFFCLLISLPEPEIP